MMKPIMSFWSEPYKRGFATEWMHKESWLLSWLLSYNYACKHYNKPTLYTDDYGIQLLVQDLQLEFAEIHNIENKLPPQFSRFYSLARAYACAQQTTSFIHIDYDAYLIDRLPQEVGNSAIFCEKIVDNIQNDIVDIRQMHDLVELPDNFATDASIKVCKMGVVGGHANEFFQNYFNSYLQILHANDAKFNNLHLRFNSEFYHGKHFMPQIVFSHYLPMVVAQNMNLQFETVFYQHDVSKCKYAHASISKQVQVDLRGRIIRRLLLEFPHTQGLVRKIMRDQDLDLPSVDAVVVPVADKSCYETVVRSTVPRNTKPNTVVVSTYNMSNEDYLSLRKLDGVRILFGQKSYAESLNAIVARTHGDLLLFIDGNVKVPALYVEKSIAAYLDNKNAIYCAACTNLLDIKQTIYGMKNVNDKTVFNFTYNNNTNYNAIDILFGGLYVMSRQSYNKIIAKDTNWQNMQNLSSIAKSLNIPLFCMNNLVVDHDRKNTSSSALARK